MEHLKVNGTHAEIGISIGRHFSEEIRRGLKENKALQNKFLPFHRSLEGQQIFSELFVLHKKLYPHYISELGGIADGANVSFEQLFIINLRGEYRVYTGGKVNRGCSTVSLKTDRHTVIGHNEDGLPIYKDSSYVVEVDTQDHPSFTAFSYPGFLCGNAFGFNNEGICFCINDVSPANVRIGIGRHFLARSLFEARSIDDAVKRITPDDRASGFNFTIGSVKENRIVNVEVTPDQFIVKEINGIDYRANHYLDIKPMLQTVGASSETRVIRAGDLIQTETDPNKSSVLRTLSDQKDSNYPIFRNALPPDDIATLATCLFDLDDEMLTIYWGHPIKEKEKSMEIPM
jgi:predicted choloylglycine hydrolase